MLRRREQEKRARKTIREPVADGVPRCSVRRRQTREHRVSLQGAVSHEARAPLDGPASGLVTLVPRREGRHRDARVDCNQRRVRSSVARTCSAVSLGNRRPGTATRPRPRRASFIGVAAASISSRPSAIVISTACPAPRPRASRSGFGTTTRPAASMVVLMAFAYHPCPGATSGAVSGQRAPALRSGTAWFARARCRARAVRATERDPPAAPPRAHCACARPAPRPRAWRDRRPQRAGPDQDSLSGSTGTSSSRYSLDGDYAILDTYPKRG